MTLYRYTASGRAAQFQTWETSGHITLPPGDFARAFEVAMRDTFEKLTKGEAVYGSPGVGCNGPYRVTEFTVEELTP